MLFAASEPERVHSIVWWYPAPRTTRAPDYPFGTDSQLLGRSSRDIRDSWGTDAYGMSELEFVTSESTSFPWGKFSRQTATPDVALEMDRIYNETDVRRAMPAITAPVLLMARERDRAALEYYASLLRHPTIRLFPGQDALTVGEMPGMLEAIRRFVGIETVLEFDTILSTVLFTDVVDSTQKQAAMGDHRYKGMIEQHHAIVRDELQRWRGVESDTAGDGFFSTFDGPARAIRCALQISEKVRELGIEIRAGIHTGECELIDGKIGGITVSIGARVAARASASEVLVSQTVKDLVAGSGLTFEWRGEHDLKGVPDRWRLYRVFD